MKVLDVVVLYIMGDARMPYLVSSLKLIWIIVRTFSLKSANYRLRGHLLVLEEINMYTYTNSVGQIKWSGTKLQLVTVIGGDQVK